MQSLLVSIIVPCYNQAKYLPEALDSVLQQTYHDWECIIVNDGSPDNTEEVANQYCNKDKRFKYIYKENGGLSSARNAGIQSSSGEFILPLDADDLIGEYYLERAIERFRDYPITKLVYCKAKMFGETNTEWILPEYHFNSLLFENMIFASALFKKSDYDKTNGYNEQLKDGYEDWDFWISLLDKHDIIYKIPEIHFFYRIRKNSMWNKMTEQLIFYTKNQIYSNHIKKYEEYIPYLIWNNPHESTQKEINKKLESELYGIRNSIAYRIGKFLLRPFSYIRHQLL
jgi:glycosyltransferase involved in cell wall biosynthesis